MLAAGQLKYFSHLSGEEQRDAAQDISRFSKDIVYSKRYSDDQNEYRHVILPKQIAKWLPKEKLMEEDEWRSYGVVQSPGWVHYMIHTPEPHILLFKRLIESSTGGGGVENGN